jgi:rhodanese-related sulfurtransferase
VEIDCQSVQQKLTDREEFLLLDCREADEHAFVKILPATLLPMSEIQTRVDELEPYRHSQIIVYCHHGVRSLQVVQWLTTQGFNSALSMAGGIDCWSTQIDESLPRY